MVYIRFWGQNCIKGKMEYMKETTGPNKFKSRRYDKMNIYLEYLFKSATWWGFHKALKF